MNARRPMARLGGALAVSPRGAVVPLSGTDGGYPWHDGELLYADDLNAAFKARSALSAKDYGAIGDGASHPLSSVTSYGGVNTTGWTLTQWQTVFPFATQVTNELDHCAVMSAIIAASQAGQAVWIPAGVYRAAETLLVTLPVAGPLVVFGDGRAATCCASYGAFDWFNLTVLPNAGAGCSIGFRGLSVYQASNVLGGQGIAVTGPAVTDGRPNITLDHCDVGNTAGGADGTVGAYTVGANLQNCSFGYANNCYFSGSRNGSGGLQGVGIRVNGNATFPSFGPVVTACAFGNLHISVQAGDGVAAYVQGMQIDACAIVYCDYGAHWVLGSSGTDNDGMTISGGTTLQCVVACVLSDGVQVHNITGNYFLGMPNVPMIHMENTHNINCFLQVSGNSFLGFGYAACNAISIENNSGASQVLYHITGNAFISFNAPPIVLASGSKKVVVTGNTFSDCVGSTDAGVNVWYNNVSLTSGGSGTNAAAMIQQGINGETFPANQGQIVWQAGATGSTYFYPAANSGGGALRFTSHVQLDGYVTADTPFGNWSSANHGKQLLITTTGNNNPAIALTDVNGVNLIGIINASGQLRFSAMPAYSDQTTAPVPLLTVSSAGITALVAMTCTNAVTFNAGVTLNTPPTFNPLPLQAANDAAAAAAGVGLGGTYRNNSALMVRVT